MAPKRAHLAACLAAALCAVAASSGWAAAKPRPRPKPKAGYIGGLYSGTVIQTAPIPGAGKIRFLVSRQTLSALNIDVAELCSHIIWTTVADAPKTVRVPISGNGSFAYDKTVLGDHLEIKGRLHGNQATGTFFDSLSSGALTCAMPHASTFSAKH